MTDDAHELIYANVVQMHVGPFDLVMDFGFKSPEDAAADPDGGKNTWTQVARIGMSHAHAKSMLPILARLIASFEENVGTIPSPGFDTKSKE